MSQWQLRKKKGLLGFKTKRKKKDEIKNDEMEWDQTLETGGSKIGQRIVMDTFQGKWQHAVESSLICSGSGE